MTEVNKILAINNLELLNKIYMFVIQNNRHLNMTIEGSTIIYTTSKTKYKLDVQLLSYVKDSLIDQFFAADSNEDLYNYNFNNSLLSFCFARINDTGISLADYNFMQCNETNLLKMVLLIFANTYADLDKELRDMIFDDCKKLFCAFARDDTAYKWQDNKTVVENMTDAINFYHNFN